MSYESACTYLVLPRRIPLDEAESLFLDMMKDHTFAEDIENQEITQTTWGGNFMGRGDIDGSRILGGSLSFHRDPSNNNVYSDGYEGRLFDKNFQNLTPGDYTVFVLTGINENRLDEKITAIMARQQAILGGLLLDGNLREIQGLSLEDRQKHLVAGINEDLLKAVQTITTKYNLPPEALKGIFMGGGIQGEIDNIAQDVCNPGIKLENTSSAPSQKPDEASLTVHKNRPGRRPGRTICLPPGR